MSVSANPEPRHGAEFVAFMGLTLGFVVATCAVGWWGVPIIALIWGAWGPSVPSQRRIGRFTAASAVSAWIALLTWTASRGPLALLATTLGEVSRVPAPVLLAVTLAFAALLAWSGVQIGAWRKRSRQD